MRVNRQYAGCGDAADDPDQSTDRTQAHRFNQKLRENVVAARAYCHAHANFARPLGYAHQHDVHDSDAAHEQRHASDCAEQDRHHP